MAYTSQFSPALRFSLANSMFSKVQDRKNLTLQKYKIEKIQFCKMHCEKYKFAKVQN